MGSKVIMLLGLLISAFYIYFFINNQEINLQQPQVVNSTVENQVDETTDAVAPEAKPTNEPTSIPEEKDEAVEVANTNKRISTPAFGFMAGEKKNQIVALMSDNDEGGELSKSIEKLCQKMECSKDMRYENDIIDAPWQKEIGKIVVLLTDGSIENGSLFIEGNVLKLEGTVNSSETQSTLSGILDSIKSDTFKVENHSNISESAKKSTRSKSIPLAKTVEQIAQTQKPQAIPEPQEVTETKSVTKEAVVAKVIEEVKPKVIPEVKQVVKKPKAKVVKKAEPKVKRTRHKTTRKPEVLPEPIMTTTLDEENQIVAEHSIKEDIPARGLVAQPSMATTIAIDDQSGGIISNTYENDSEAQIEIEDLLLSNPIDFESRSSKITKESRDILDKIAQIVNEAENSNIIIEGYANSGDDKVYNKVLSQKRADTVKRYLKSKKIKSKTIRSVGRGEDINIESSVSTSGGRVEIRFITGEKR